MPKRKRHNNNLVKLAHEEAFNCHYCGDYVPLPRGTRDHVVPRSFGGPGFLWNLVYACETCNHGLGHTYMKCDCSKCASARLRWETEEMMFDQILRIKPHLRLHVMLIREEARDRHGLRIEQWRRFSAEQIGDTFDLTHLGLPRRSTD